MSTFNEITIDAIEAVFNTLTPVDIVYKPSGKADRTIEALIFYSNENVDNRVRGRISVQTIIVRNSSSTGIAVEEIDTGLDSIELPVRQGSGEVKESTMEIVNQNVAFLRLQVK